MAQKKTKKKRTPRQPSAREAKLAERLAIEKDYSAQIRENSRMFEADLKQDLKAERAAHRAELKALKAAHREEMVLKNAAHRRTLKQLRQAMRLIDRVASAAQTTTSEE